VPAWPTPMSVRRAAGTAVGAALLLGAATALAPSAAAVDDPARPDYAVTSGPSCHPGGVQIRVVAGTAPYRVVLATTRQPGGEDSADLVPGETAVLSTGDVDWGETIDSRLEFTALDGSGDAFTDELVPFTFTRPAEEDCAAIAPSLAGNSPATVPATVPGAATGEGDDAASAPGDVQLEATASAAAVSPAPAQAPWAAAAAGVALAGAAGGVVLAARRRATSASGTMDR
jgi:hypothetical protein